MDKELELEAEKVLAKHSKNYKKTVEQDEKPLFYLVVNGHEAINAMEEYASSRVKKLEKEVERLKGLVEKLEQKLDPIYPMGMK